MTPDVQACGERLIQRPEPVDPKALSVTSISILTTLISLGCTALVVILVAKKQERSRHSFVASICCLSILLGSLSLLLEGFVQKTCERACTEAWIATFDENWRPRATHAQYGWFYYVPKVLGHKDSNIYRAERKWANDERWEKHEKKLLKAGINSMAGLFRMIVAVMIRAWANLYAFVVRRYNVGASGGHQ